MRGVAVRVWIAVVGVELDFVRVVVMRLHRRHGGERVRTRRARRHGARRRRHAGAVTRYSRQFWKLHILTTTLPLGISAVGSRPARRCLAAGGKIKYKKASPLRRRRAHTRARHTTNEPTRAPGVGRAQWRARGRPAPTRDVRTVGGGAAQRGSRARGLSARRAALRSAGAGALSAAASAAAAAPPPRARLPHAPKRRIYLPRMLTLPGRCPGGHAVRVRGELPPRLAGCRLLKLARRPRGCDGRYVTKLRPARRVELPKFTQLPLSTMSALIHEKIWLDKTIYHDAERDYYESLSKMDSVATLAAVPNTELSNKVNSLEKENSELKKTMDDLRKLVISLQARVEPAPKQDTQDSDDGVDLFGSDDEEESAEAARIREERLSAYNAKKSKKPVLIAKSNIILDVKPWDDETDMAALEQSVRAVNTDGLLWGASKLVPLAYGIHKLQISCVVEDDKVSVDWLTEEIEKVEDFVQSVDIAAFNKV
ncbi:hypothetical protein MSG28_010983 [Choristoneura fumiferana]|uniref:Uncharacterized protein n=2 Tax=Choristoneura fumiferana TaxID=7141 RepID=A0ACC0KPP7_CHOFU|nr:hypothetical protein MSG28_010983 [Choristoneura fumiferana]